MNAKTKKYFLLEGSEIFAGPYWNKAEAQAAARREGKYSPSPGIWKKKRLRVKEVTSNPAAEAAEASTEFHGRGPRNAERRHEGSRAATDYCDRQMHVALAAMLAEEASK